MSHIPRQSISRKSIRSGVPKPSVPKPSTSRPSIASRPSTSRPSIPRQSGISRSSTIGAAIKIDVKANVSKNIKDILSFLTEREYPHVLTKKNLTSPTEMTFKEVLKFIIRDIDRTFECQRVAKDVIELVTGLGYPYSLKESHFKPVGSPHSWPFLLEVLAWLCDLIITMEHEKHHISKLLTLECKDDNDTDGELQHILLRRRLYTEYLSNVTDFPSLKTKYNEELDIPGKCNSLKAECKELAQEIDIYQAEKAKFPEKEADMKLDIEKEGGKCEEMQADKAEFEMMIASLKSKLLDAHEVYNEKKEQNFTLQTTLGDLVNDNEKRELIVSIQPPQHEVQKIRQHYSDLLDKKHALERDNKKLFDGNAEREVIRTNRQRQLKEKWRELIGVVRECIPDVKFDYDRAIDNRSIVQAAHLKDVFEKKLFQQKEETRRLESQLFNQKMELQRLEDDTRLSSEKCVNQNNKLKQKEAHYRKYRTERILKSKALSEQLDRMCVSISELQEQLKQHQSYGAIEEKIAEEEYTIVGLLEKLYIYGIMLNNRTQQIDDLSDEASYKYRYTSLVLQLAKSRAVGIPDCGI